MLKTRERAPAQPTLLLLHVGEVFKREGSHRGSPEGVGLHDGLQAGPDRHKRERQIAWGCSETHADQMTRAQRETESRQREKNEVEKMLVKPVQCVREPTNCVYI